MDVDKLFKLPKLPQSSLNKRKWKEPDATALKAARVEEVDEDDSRRQQSQAGPSKPQKAANVQDVDEDGDESGAFAPGNDADYFVDEDDEGGRFFGGGLTTQQKRILELMSDADTSQQVGSGGGADDGQSLEQELKALRKQLLRLERAINKNQEMRVKYADDPQRLVHADRAEELIKACT